MFWECVPDNDFEEIIEKLFVESLILQRLVDLEDAAASILLAQQLAQHIRHVV